MNTASDNISVVARNNEAQHKDFRFKNSPTTCAVEGNRLYVTQAETIAVAVLDKDQKVVAQPAVHLQGFVPTRWYSTKVFANEGQPLVLSANKVFSCYS